jgi:hypothetical protein
MQMQTETFIIMIVGLLAIGLIRLIIAMVGREYAADHPHVKSKGPRSVVPSSAPGDATDGDAALSVPSQRPIRGTGRKSHLLYFPESDQVEPAAENQPADSEPVLPSA